VGFRRMVEDFTCEHCGADNAGDGYTNHCAHCLWSRHVDVEPGDRAASCGGLMEPVDALLERDRWFVVHRCTGCGVRRRCRTSPDDDLAVAVEVVRRRAERFR
jgi:RNHCP domain